MENPLVKSEESENSDYSSEHYGTGHEIPYEPVMNLNGFDLSRFQNSSELSQYVAMPTHTQGLSPHIQLQLQQLQHPQHNSTQSTSTTTEQSLIPATTQNPGQDYFDITPFITYSQEKAAKKLGIPKSTLSKRWREATCNRKWPYRQLCKVDREIKTLVHNMHSQGGSIDPQLQSNLAGLMRQRQEESRMVYIKNISAPSKTKLMIQDGTSSSELKLDSSTAHSNGIWNQTLNSTLTSEILRNIQPPIDTDKYKLF